MSGNSSVKTIFVSAAIFIMMEIAALAMLSRSSTLQNIWINRASHRVTAALWGGGENIRTLFSLRSLNEELAADNSELSRQLHLFQLQEEARIEAGLTESIPHDNRFIYIPATIVKSSRNTAHNYIILNKGSEDGVKPNTGIISGNGVVGIVNAVDKHFSYGLTLMNNNVSIGARISRTGYLALLVWDGIHTDGAYLKDVPLHHTIAPGDTVVTSGFSTIFPPDFPIGIAGESVMVDGSVFQTSVTLFQDFSTLKYVTIVEDTEKDEIAALEAAMESKAK